MNRVLIYYYLKSVSVLLTHNCSFLRTGNIRNRVWN